MALTLQKLDAVRARTGATYAECWRALRASGGNAVEAIVRLEDEAAGSGWTGASVDVGARVRHLAGEVARVRLAVRRDARTVIEVPALAGAIGAVLFPRVVAAGVAAALVARCSLVVERPAADP
jgi:hypothetical protein